MSADYFQCDGCGKGASRLWPVSTPLLGTVLRCERCAEGMNR